MGGKLFEKEDMGTEESEAISQWQITAFLYYRTVFNGINDRNKINLIKKFFRDKMFMLCIYSYHIILF